MRIIDADALLTERKKSKYYHLPNGDVAIPIIDIEHAPTVEPKTRCIAKVEINKEDLEDLVAEKMEEIKERILQAGMKGKEVELRIGGRLFRIREVAQ